MRILVIQFIPATRGRRVPRFEPQLGTLLSLLEKREHTLSFLGLARFDLNAVKAALARTLPQLIYADISAVCVDAARRTLEYIEHHEFLPIVAGGAFPTIAPAESLSLPGVQAVAIGEPDASLVTYFERMKDPAVGQIVSGVWLRDERGTSQPDVPPLVEDLNSLPFPHRALFNYADHVREAGEIEIATSRGNPENCNHTLNERISRLYQGRGDWVRRRSPGNILAEIAQVRQRHEGVRTVRFFDQAFALDEEWLTAFLTAYKRQCDLPFRCHLRVQAADEGTVARLAEAGCRLADVEVMSSSYLIRYEIFGMDLSGEQIRACFTRLQAAGIRSRAILYLGAPYESEASLEETRTMLRDLKPDIADLRPYYPWPGSRARDLCQEQGWIHARGEEQYHNDRCGIDMPACRPDVVAAALRRLRAEFPAAIDEPWWRRWSQASRTALGQVFRRRSL